MPRRQEQDPYAPPPMHRDRSGGIVRIAIIAALLGAAAWGYMSFTSQEQTAVVPEPMQEQEMADASGYTTPPPAAPAAETAPAPQSAPAPAPRRSPSAPSTSTQSVPPPSTTSTPPATPVPIPPVDTPPTG